MKRWTSNLDELRAIIGMNGGFINNEYHFFCEPYL